MNLFQKKQDSITSMDETMSSTTVHCKQCKYCRITLAGNDSILYLDPKTRYKCKQRVKQDELQEAETGISATWKTYYCYDERNSTDPKSCGPEGRFYVERLPVRVMKRIKAFFKKG